MASLDFRIGVMVGRGDWPRGDAAHSMCSILGLMRPSSAFCSSRESHDGAGEWQGGEEGGRDELL